MVKILTYPDPLLRQPLFDVDERFSITRAVLQMEEVMREYDGIGLAAPQIGIPYKLIIMKLTGQPLFVACNPRILSAKGVASMEESCLSVPGVVVRVQRKAEIVLEYRDKYFRLQRKAFKGLAAICIQHELDHLRGVTIADHAQLSSIRMASDKKDES